MMLAGADFFFAQFKDSVEALDLQQLLDASHDSRYITAMQSSCTGYC